MLPFVPRVILMEFAIFREVLGISSKSIQDYTSKKENQRFLLAYINLTYFTYGTEGVYIYIYYVHVGDSWLIFGSL